MELRIDSSSTVNNSFAISILVNVRIKICRVDVSSYQFIARYAVNVICNFLDYSIAIITNVDFVRSKVRSDSSIKLGIVFFSTVKNSLTVSVLIDMRIKLIRVHISGDQFVKAYAISEVCDLLNYSAAVLTNIDLMILKVSGNSSAELCVFSFSAGKNSLAISILINTRIKEAEARFHISGNQIITSLSATNEVCDFAYYVLTLLINDNSAIYKVSSNSIIEFSFIKLSTGNKSLTVSILVDVRIRLVRFFTEVAVCVSRSNYRLGGVKHRTVNYVIILTNRLGYSTIEFRFVDYSCNRLVYVAQCGANSALFDSTIVSICGNITTAVACDRKLRGIYNLLALKNLLDEIVSRAN